MSLAQPQSPRLPDRACLLLASFLILAAAAGRAAFLLLDCPLDLAPDEAHYWDWSRHPDWSYYSKGPLVAWIIGASCWLLGDLSVSLTGNLMFAIRAPALLFGAGLLFSVYALAVQASRSHRLALAVVAVLLSHPAIAAGSSLMTIDSPYTCLWAVALTLALRAVRTDERWAWLLCGAVVALGILAKYTMALFLPSLALYLLFSPQRRDLLARPGPWLLVAVSALACVPILLWNASHGWVTFLHVFHIAGGEREGFKWFGPLAFLGGQALVMLGVWLAFWLCAVVAYRPWADGDEGRAYLWWMSVPTFALFLAASAKKGSGEINWPIACYLSGAVLAAIWAASCWERGG
ncbi:MAG: glycosyltransferase family 39 protein, partial [Gemmataceae bacterium]|nr:glycosyltransferase family 39 protein [Gemmataceae bacterium]